MKLITKVAAVAVTGLLSLNAMAEETNPASIENKNIQVLNESKIAYLNTLFEQIKDANNSLVIASKEMASAKVEGAYVTTALNYESDIKAGTKMSAAAALFSYLGTKFRPDAKLMQSLQERKVTKIVGGLSATGFVVSMSIGTFGNVVLVRSQAQYDKFQKDYNATLAQRDVLLASYQEVSASVGYNFDGMIYSFDGNGPQVLGGAAVPLLNPAPQK